MAESPRSGRTATECRTVCEGSCDQSPEYQFPLRQYPQLGTLGSSERCPRRDLLQVYTNFEIGRRIVEEEQQGANRAQYGKEIVRELAARLTREFGSGFSKTNLEYMRRFYLAYPGRTPQIAQTASGQFPAFAIAQTLSGQLQDRGQPQSPF